MYRCFDHDAKLRVLRAVSGASKSFLSGVKCWVAFAQMVSCPQMPAFETHVRWWLTTFRRAETAANYLSYLKKVHMAYDMPIWFETPGVRAVLKGTKKDSERLTKPKVAIRIGDLERMVPMLDRVNRQLADVAILSYWFMFRVPSEAIPLQWSGDHSSVFLNKDNSVTIWLERRKNLPSGMEMTRPCVCHRVGERLCPHTVVQNLMMSQYMNVGSQNVQIFSVKYNTLLEQMRKALKLVGFKNHELVGTHALRRGCAQDLLKTGATLRDLLEAGGWRSSAFQIYIKRSEIEEDAAARIIIDSDDEENKPRRPVRAVRRGSI